MLLYVIVCHCMLLYVIVCYGMLLYLDFTSLLLWSTYHTMLNNIAIILPLHIVVCKCPIINSCPLCLAEWPILLGYSGFISSWNAHLIPLKILFNSYRHLWQTNTTWLTCGFLKSWGDSQVTIGFNTTMVIHDDWMIWGTSILGNLQNVSKNITWCIVYIYTHTYTYIHIYIYTYIHIYIYTYIHIYIYIIVYMEVLHIFSHIPSTRWTRSTGSAPATLRGSSPTPAVWLAAPAERKSGGEEVVNQSLWIQPYLLKARKWDWGIMYNNLEGYISTFSDSGHGSIVNVNHISLLVVYNPWLCILDYGYAFEAPTTTNTGWWFQPLWKIWVGMIIPNIWKVIIHSCSSHHQPE